jgi:hypothetical protein
MTTKAMAARDLFFRESERMIAARLRFDALLTPAEKAETDGVDSTIAAIEATRAALADKDAAFWAARAGRFLVGDYVREHRGLPALNSMVVR